MVSDQVLHSVYHVEIRLQARLTQVCYSHWEDEREGLDEPELEDELCSVRSRLAAKEEVDSPSFFVQAPETGTCSATFFSGAFRGPGAAGGVGEQATEAKSRHTTASYCSIVYMRARARRASPWGLVVHATACDQVGGQM